MGHSQFGKYDIVDKFHVIQSIINNNDLGMADRLSLIVYCMDNMEDAD